jgi:hypothetical protein
MNYRMLDSFVSLGQLFAHAQSVKRAITYHARAIALERP